MAIVQCANNHYYDDKRNHTCPYCEKLGGFPQRPEGINEQMTSYVLPEDFDDDDGQVTQGYGDDVGQEERTIGIFMDESHSQLTTGWLVCIDGAMKGKSFVINSGRNFAGRSFQMDIGLSDDMSIAEENHFAVVYDPRSVAFYLVCGQGHTYVNGAAVNDQCQLKENDQIQAGQSTFLFIPFCKEGREWN